MRGQHGFLQSIVGVFCIPTAPPGEAMQLHAVAPEQFLERPTVTGGVSRKQFGVSALAGGVGGKAGHGRTVITATSPGTSPGTASVGALGCGVSRRRGR